MPSVSIWLTSILILKSHVQYSYHIDFEISDYKTGHTLHWYYLAFLCKGRHVPVYTHPFNEKHKQKNTINASKFHTTPRTHKVAIKMSACVCLDSADGFPDICGPSKELDEDTCQCVCRRGLQPSSCGPHKELDRNSCQCVCKNKLFPKSCGANREFDENTCQCICKRTCPRNQPLNPGKCVCECTENSQKCFLKGKKFQHQTCR